MSKNISILSTKKLKPTVIKEALLSELAIFDVDFIEISYNVNESIAKALSNSKECLVFTSQHAVKAFIFNKDRFNFSLQQHKIYCLQNETLKAAEKIENSEIISSAKDATSLAQKIVADKVKTVSFICGNRRRDELPKILTSHQIEVEEVKVYETKHTGQPVMYSYEAILFFSPSGVGSFFQKNILPQDTACFCIGSITASVVKIHTNNHIIIAADSTQESILEAVKIFFKNKKTKEDDLCKRNNAINSSKIEK